MLLEPKKLKSAFVSNSNDHEKTNNYDRWRRLKRENETEEKIEMKSCEKQKTEKFLSESENYLWRLSGIAGA